LSTRSRIVGFGSAALLVIAGIVCAFAFSGGLGQNLAFGLVALGLVEGTALVFYEVGLTEDHARAREEHARADAAMERDRERDRADRDATHATPDDRPRGERTSPAHPPERSGRVRLDRDRSHPSRRRRLR
jgi:hypothetical protein